MAQKYFKANLERIESLRIARGWSRDALAAKAILSIRTLDSIVAGEQGVLSTFRKIAKAFEVPIESILEGYVEQPDPPPSQPKERRYRVTFEIATPYDDFDESKDLPKFFAMLFKRFGGDDLPDPTVTPGSTKITVQMDQSQVDKLVEAMKNREADDLAFEIDDFSQQFWPSKRPMSESGMSMRVLPSGVVVSTRGKTLIFRGKNSGNLAGGVGQSGLSEQQHKTSPDEQTPKNSS